MKITNLLKFTHQDARKLTMKIEGAADMSDSSLTERELNERDAQADFYGQLQADAQELYDQAVNNSLIPGLEYGIEDRRLEGKILSAMRNVSNVDADEVQRLETEKKSDDLILLERLLGLLPQRYRKKSGKSLNIEGTNVFLSINTGQREYRFVFPLSAFEQ